jgi:hypothetical protein
MAVEASTRRRVRNVAAVVALVGVAATGLVVAFRDEATTAAGRDVAEGERLRVTLVVKAEDQLLADATATVRVTNTSDRPAWYKGDECDGPGRPVVRPDGTPARQGPTLSTGSIRDRLIAAGESALSVELVPPDPGLCDPDERPVEVDPGATLTFEYRTGATPVDRSSAVAANAVVREADRRGRTIGRLRVTVPFPEVSGEGGLTIDRAVDAFLADPTVASLVAAVEGDGVLVGVTRDGGIWRMSLGSIAGDVSGEVHPDLVVRDVALAEGTG